ncbi:RdgB/HAM1 family non-canonical purine NTP pyrophosphatase [Cupriavidus necator]|uniref:dITP/XTP pyrophosphatase n=1 Tax=Cupriavidus necator (strain ATCC 17699 / DSM 428 / KCTC 22496 / NCIMB 10442 / H16 / Stanier 337) TaxID=381666 RepID=Q0KD28_CUPNH|nr:MULTISPECIES: RdgB/HAM1 family non-canonical purine NTP pyrophosphatase [Cupriavidus]EON21844.1 dITP/XTP pyrophosphatase [Cupriavidus sp. GA3-3]KUE89577.1 non-canonical purine NTP pyrophosphatase [Cupriavidus necator]QCC00009.1 RdgB/HAM1 family non-canonical purine NTP pyrophosphatase [Cupriavidus necator H16]QQB77178.1 RdgB/HAM1 family non-canonical purine NTP pyrophosphatase [Cupriavidus necator]WKA41857.1 RdgB/HAM1 family non-canonical purine NTP pyrophosphatase [Cupriavidus necator]
MQRLVLASNNAGKLREFGALLAPLGFDVVPQGELGIPEAEEPFATFVENALAKARHASRLAGLPALADDSGICVQALDGAPGVYSARYAQMAGQARSDAANNAHLVSQLAGKLNRHAHYYCVLVFVRHAEDPCPIIAEGLWHGEVVDAPRGAGGFGYDPHFLLPHLGKTAAELSPEEKNTVSHRAQALRALVARLQADAAQSATR